ncbi:uncharacterized protein [Haliotis cracherodii]|uniref:uncharacterized protein n=1 Tax=Haliotis cracherodii TaxID=6455 RepID=UPI0039EB5E60
MLFGVKKFHQYLAGNHFTIETDHKPLLGLFAETKAIPMMTSARIQREEFKAFMDKNGIHHVQTAPYHPSSNGLAERTTPQTTTGQTPAKLLMNLRLRKHLDLTHPSVQQTVKKSQWRQKIQHDLHVKDRSMKEQDTVYVKNFGNGMKWLPGTVSNRTGPLSFEVELSDGRNVRRHQDHVRTRETQIPGGNTDSHSDQQVESALPETRGVEIPAINDYPEKDHVSERIQDPASEIVLSTDNSNVKSPVLSRSSKRTRREPRYFEDFVRK